MALNLVGRIKVKGVKPVPVEKRIKFDITVGLKYYISFEDNQVYPCILKEIITTLEPKQIKVVSQLNKLKKDGGAIFYNEFIVYAHEIGRTPEEAAKNVAVWLGI